MSMKYICFTDTPLHVEETGVLCSLINTLFNLQMKIWGRRRSKQLKAPESERHHMLFDQVNPKAE